MPEETEPIEVWSNSLIWQARGEGWGAGECCPQVTQVTAAESTLSLYFLNSDSSFHLGFPDLPQILRCLKGQKIYNIFLRLISSYSHFFFPKRNLMGIGIKTHIPFSILNKWMALVFPFAFIRLPLCSLCLWPSITYHGLCHCLNTSPVSQQTQSPSSWTSWSSSVEKLFPQGKCPNQPLEMTSIFRLLNSKWPVW